MSFLLLILLSVSSESLLFTSKSLARLITDDQNVSRFPKRKKKKKKKDADAEEEEEKEEEKKPPGLLFSLCWYRVIVDEAHVARNPRARISNAVAKLDSVFRWALTGTVSSFRLPCFYSVLNGD
jgi:hypothetical protein